MSNISVVICTRNRAVSLAETLEALIRAAVPGISYDVIVVDNASDDDTPGVVAAFGSRMAVRRLHEPRVGENGKALCLNRALDSQPAGDLIAVLDDDISVQRGWFQGVMAISARWPAGSLFTGPSRIDRPAAAIPGWAAPPRIRGFVLSVVDHGPADRPLRDGGSFSENHYWFRAQVLASGIRFPEIWNPGPTFFNQLLERGHTGFYGPDASVLHRIQDHLLTPSFALERAKATGRSAARMRLVPYRDCITAARLCRRHPVLARCYCAAQVARWSAWWITGGIGRRDARFGRRLVATKEITYHAELLRLCGMIDEYQLFRT